MRRRPRSAHTISLAVFSLLATTTPRPAYSAEDQPIVVAASPKAGGHVHPSICKTRDGTLVVVFKGPNVLLRARSTDGGRTWEKPEPIPTTARRPGGSCTGEQRGSRSGPRTG